MRVGILGGTFDPIHLGHLVIAEEVRVSLGLDQIVFIPTGQPWLKQGKVISPAKMRLEMARLATQDNQNFTVSDVEILRAGPTYTVETLRELRGASENYSGPFFIVGRDSLRELHRWNDPQGIFQMCTIVVVDRPGYENTGIAQSEIKIPGIGDKVVHVPGLNIGISGTEIRRRITQRETIRYWVPRNVEAYIIDNQLYLEEPK